MLPRQSLCTSLEWINTDYLWWFKSFSHVPLKMHTLLLSAPYFALSRENTGTGIGSLISLYYRWGDQVGTGLSSRFLASHRHRRNECITDIVDHLSGLFAIVVFVASLSIYCTWSFHVAFNWDWAGNSHSWGLRNMHSLGVCSAEWKQHPCPKWESSDTSRTTAPSSLLLCAFLALLDNFFIS